MQTIQSEIQKRAKDKTVIIPADTSQLHYW